MNQKHANLTCLKRLLLLLALTVPLLLTQCETVTVAMNGSAATPRHGFSKAEYPFDKAGNYREEWVRYP